MQLAFVELGSAQPGREPGLTGYDVGVVPVDARAHEQVPRDQWHVRPRVAKTAGCEPDRVGRDGRRQCQQEHGSGYWREPG